jgi:hypothetical protein
MPKWLKVLLALFVFAVLGLGMVVGSCVWWVSANKDRLVTGTQAAQREGASFGRTHSQGECIDDSIERVKSCGQLDLPCEVMVKLRLGSCLPVATDDGACARYESQTNLVKEAFLGNEDCKRRGQAGSAACGRLMQGVPEECRKAKASFAPAPESAGEPEDDSLPAPLPASPTPSAPPVGAPGGSVRHRRP